MPALSSPFRPADADWPEVAPPLPGFTLWLEFELWQDAYDPEDAVFNMTITLSDGKYYALNVWTYSCSSRVVSEAQYWGENLAGKYMLPPDLFVARLDRALLEAVVSHLIHKNQLRADWMDPNPLNESLTLHNL